MTYFGFPSTDFSVHIDIARHYSDELIRIFYHGSLSTIPDAACVLFPYPTPLLLNSYFIILPSFLAEFLRIYHFVLMP